MIDLKPVGAADAELIFKSWGRYPENFDRLTARVFVDVADAQRYLTSLSRLLRVWHFTSFSRMAKSLAS